MNNFTALSLRYFTEQYLGRFSSAAHPSEISFLRARARRISQDRQFWDALRIPSMPEPVCPEDVPKVAIAGSGGGYRAKFGFLGALQGLEACGLDNCAFWIGGVSGSCWTIAGLYTVARLNVKTLAYHYKAVASEGIHPMSRNALDQVGRSSNGVYFLVGPLLSKLRNGDVGIGIMDMYATLISSYQLLSRSSRAHRRLSRSTFQCGSLWVEAC